MGNCQIVAENIQTCDDITPLDEFTEWAAFESGFGKA
jgi:hypothetical protein